jgi:hypothetical protein
MTTEENLERIKRIQSMIEEVKKEIDSIEVLVLEHMRRESET